MQFGKDVKETDRTASAVLEKMEKNKWKYSLLACVGISVTLILLTIGMAIFHDYRNALMKNQQDQLLLMAQSLSKNMSSDMVNYVNELEFFATIVDDDANDGLMHTYVDRNLDYALNIFVEGSDGEIIKSVRPVVFTSGSDGPDLSENVTAENISGSMVVSDLQCVTRVREGITIWQGYEGKRHVLLFKKEIDGDSGRKLVLMIDEDEYYDHMIADIKIGTNGYIVIKNSDNLMVMHPSEDQWGISVISGRRLMYPNLDYSSLENLLEKQNSGEAGVSDYYSYWWLDESLPRVRKISGYSPVSIGDDFWIVSAVVDYDDFYRPIMEGFQGIILVGLGILLVFMIAFLSILRLIKANDSASHEIDYLKNLNQVLEEMHRSENAIAHQQRLQIMGTMTGGIAHEFNNFLTPIMGHAELLMMNLPEESEEYDSAREILMASEKARDVVHQMSGMSRKNVETIFRNIEVTKLVSRFFRMSRSVCPEDIEVVTENHVSEAFILGNSTQINQVLLNITVNGVQAMEKTPKKSLKLNAYMEHRSDIRYRELPKESIFKKYLVFEISDTGTGMSNKVKKQIFEPFYTTKKPGEGTGLGLSLAEQIVEEHKGFIHIDTELNKGTTFYVYFPIVEMQNEDYSEKNVPEDRNLQGTQSLPGTGDLEDNKKNINIIVVDDNHKILSILNDSLNENAFIRAYMCDSTESLHEALREMTPDIVLIDETVGSYSGIEIFMSQVTEYKNALKILMADTIDREIVEAKKRGIINGYMEKPVSDVEILKLAEQISRNISNLNDL